MAEPTPPAVQVRGLTKRYGARTAVDGLDLDVLPSEVLGFLGPNGAGKTTTARVLLGLLRASAGSVRVLGLDPWRRACEVHAGTGYVPGDVRLPPQGTAGDLLRLYTRLRADVPGGAVTALAERLDLDLSRRVGALSKGNRQKVALVQALAGRPRLLVLDEPTSGLDPLAQEEVAALLRERADDGVAVLLSSHVLGEVERVADRVAVLREGRLVRLDLLSTLREQARHHVRVRLADPAAAAVLTRVPGAQGLRADGDAVRCTVPAASLDALVKALATVRVLDVSVQQADLEELFLETYRGTGPDGGGDGSARPDVDGGPDARPAPEREVQGAT